VEQLKSELKAALSRAVTALKNDGVPQWTLAPITHIDGERFVLSTVGGVRTAATGEVIVSQPKDSELLVFSSSGELLRRIGGPGDGPGEFSFVGGFGLLGDTIWVHDWVARRLTYLSLDGAQLQITPFVRRDLASLRGLLPLPLRERADEFSLMWPDALSPDGSAIALVSPWLRSDRGGTTPVLPLVAVGRDLQPLRLLALLPTSEVVVEVGTGAQKHEVGLEAPFGKELLGFVTSPGGKRMAILTVDYSRSVVRILQLELNGDTLSQGELRFRKKPVARADMAVHAEMLAAQLQIADAEKVILRSLRQRPAAYEPFEQILLSDDGLVWLGAQTTLDEQLWLCVGPNGTVLGYLILASNWQPVTLEGERVWVLARDSMEVSSIAGYRVVR
jgi:hypothetical protein